jgi:hypothetical protein
MIRFDTGQFYIGKRSAPVPPEQDTKYLGSPVTYKHLWKDPTLTKTKHILRVVSTHDELVELETKLIKEGWRKYPDQCLNRNASPAFHPDACKLGASIIAEKTKKKFSIMSPDGTIVHGENIRKFCRENNLDQRHFFKVLTGTRNHHKGWRRVPSA